METIERFSGGGLEVVYRILHCGNSIENYNKCIDEGVVGFKTIAPTAGDVIYLVVKVGMVSTCGARGILGAATDKKPWGDALSYSNCRSLEQPEYCEPFDASILKSVGGPYWAARYFQSSKAIKDKRAVRLLEETFNAKRRDKPIKFLEEEK
jgi:hypothetical protein